MIFLRQNRNRNYRDPQAQNCLYLNDSMFVWMETRCVPLDYSFTKYFIAQHIIISTRSTSVILVTAIFVSQGIRENRDSNDDDDRDSNDDDDRDSDDEDIQDMKALLGLLLFHFISVQND